MMEITGDPPSVLDVFAVILAPVFVYVLFNGNLRPQRNFRNVMKTCLHLAISFGVPALLQVLFIFFPLSQWRGGSFSIGFWLGSLGEHVYLY